MLEGIDGMKEGRTRLARELDTNLRGRAARAGFPRGRGKQRPGRARSPESQKLAARSWELGEKHSEDDDDDEIEDDLLARPIQPRKLKIDNELQM
jgi:hypothetical protein